MFDTTDIKGKVILLRLDLNVPTEGTRVTDFTRIDRVKPTLDALRARGARVAILAHFGRPKAKPEDAYSMKFLPPVLAERWGFPVSFASDCIGDVARDAIAALPDGGVVLLENVRFHAGEEKDEPAFAASLARLGQFYINDAFSVSHRAHASVHGLAKLLPAQAGLTMKAELAALDAAIANPKRPVGAIVGGSKVSTKLDLLGNLVTKMDVLVLGGGMANTFLASRGWKPEASLYEADMLDTARAISAKADEHGCRIVLPTDGVMAETYAADAQHKVTLRPDIPAGWQVLDVGPDTVKLVEEALAGCKTILWNGPLGVFEMPAFAKGTNAVANWVSAQTKAGRVTSVAGGGDTVAALSQAGAIDGFTYVSTAGGAFLEWLEGKELPGVSVLAKAPLAA
ncbi:MAG: phosphoglycerate kinase [Alphaproteobacteria bacterium]|nr:phosphoglycerate kinase [Alphaproteobacteria bacterium]